jgi:hypothetical protein
MVSEEIIVPGAAFLVVAVADGAVVTALALLKELVTEFMGVELVFAVLVSFSKRTCGALELLGRSEVVLLAEIDEEELEDLLLEDDVLLDDSVDELEEEGIDTGVGVGDALDDDAAAGLESEEFDSPALKTVI